MINDFKVKSKFLDEIKNEIKQIRRQLKIKYNQRVNVSKILEIFPFELFEKNKYEDQNLHAYTDPTTKKIYIREDIYDGMYKEYGRDRMTVSHEIFHRLIHIDQFTGLSRTYGNLKPWESAEWQAKAYAGEFLCPSNKILCKLSIKTIAKNYGISKDAAKIQKQRALKQWKIKINENKK